MKKMIADHTTAFAWCGAIIHICGVIGVLIANTNTQLMWWCIAIIFALALETIPSYLKEEIYGVQD